MKMPKEALEQERQAFIDVWEFRKKYYAPEEGEEYWRELVRSADALIKKYPESEYLRLSVMANMSDIEARGGHSTKQGGAWPAVLDADAVAPVRGSDRAAGYDLRTTTDLVIMPEEVAEIHTGFHVQPSGSTMGLLFMRSGLAKRGLRLTTGVSVIDPDYTGEIIAYVLNAGNEIFRLSKGDRVCQLVFVRFVVPVLDYVDKLPETKRGAGGFGSTGVQ